MKNKQANKYLKIGYWIAGIAIIFLCYAPAVFAQGDGASISGIVNNVVNFLIKELQLVMTAVAVFAVLWRVVRAMMLGSDNFAKTKEEIMFIAILYILGLSAAPFIQSLANSAGNYG